MAIPRGDNAAHGVTILTPSMLVEPGVPGKETRLCIFQHMHTSNNNPGTKTAILRVDSPPHGAETPSLSANH